MQLKSHSQREESSLYFPNWPVAANDFSTRQACSVPFSLSACLTLLLLKPHLEIKLISQLAEGCLQKRGTTET